MINFPGIPNATVYGRAKGAPKTPPQRPVKATVYGHATGAPKTPQANVPDTTIYGHAKLYQ